MNDDIDPGLAIAASDQIDCDMASTFVGGHELSPYLEVWKGQLDGVKFMQKRKRVINRDKPGTGKTFQGVYASVGPTIICVPANLAEQWWEWLAGQTDKKRPNFHPPYHPIDEDRIYWATGDYYGKLDTIKKAVREGFDFLIINHEMVATHEDVLRAIFEDGYVKTLVIDEAHRFRNHQSARAKIIRSHMAPWVEYCYELTATPVWKEVDDLFMQLSILQPEIFTSWYKFVDLYCIADTTRWSTKVLGMKKEQIPEMEELLKVMSIGRTSAEMGRPLPPAIPHFIKVKFPKELKNAYDQMRDDYVLQLLGESVRFDNFSQIMRMLRLMTAAGNLKADAIKDILEDIPPNEPVVIFCWYRETCEALASYLGGVAIHGGVKSSHPSQETDQAYRRRLALSSRIRVATIGSLSEGIDLSDARTLIYAEEHYTPGSEEQSSSRVIRARRPNDNKFEPVQVYYVHIEDTIDEAIHKVSKSRGGTATDVLGLTLGLQL